MTTSRKSESMPSSKVNKRVERSRHTVLTTAFELLSEGGVASFTVDEVSRRSGVAKTTIYRHWPTREALVVDACSRMIEEQETPDTGSLQGDVTIILVEIAHLLQTANWPFVLPSIIDTAERNPEFAEIHSQIQHGHAAPLREVLGRAVARGELSATADVSTIVAALLGPLFYRRWFSRQPIDEQFVKSIIKQALS